MQILKIDVKKLNQQALLFFYCKNYQASKNSKFKDAEKPNFLMALEKKRVN